MRLLNELHDWFYAPISSRIVALYRIALGLVLLATCLLFAPYLKPFFSDQGYISVAQLAAHGVPHEFSIFMLNDSLWFVVSMYVLLILGCLSLITGVYSRIGSIACYMLYMSYVHRFPNIAFDGDVVLVIALFFTIFLETDRAWTPRWYEKRYPSKEYVAGWPARLIQINLAMIYVFAGIAKFRSDAWLDGTQFVNSVTFQYATINLYWLSLLPVLNNLFTLGTVFLEFIVPLAIWRPSTRIPVLIGLFLMHIAIALLINVTYYSEVMIACLTIFMCERDLAWLRQQYISSITWLYRHLPKQNLLPKF